jgi:hypothetical protein
MKTVEPRNLKRPLLAAAAAAAGLALAAAAASSPAAAQQTHDEGAGVKVGQLICNAAGGWGYILGSSREVNCTYQPTEKRTERYVGSITKVGVDIGYKGAGVLLWTVVAPTTNVAPGALAGDYAGLTAGASAIVGASANGLIGGSNKQIALQPLSIEGNTGINVAAGIGALHLKYVHGRY